jgi:sugar O-acyltransferase (sialic acid O-acetyltransferase NeuD family)
MSKRRLVILGDGAFAEVAYECFTHDSDYEVAAFSVEAAYRKRESLFGLPVVPFETLAGQFAPADFHVYAALVYTQLNRLRTRLYLGAKGRGYRPASYVSSRAFVWRNVAMGEHCFVFEDNTLQPFVRLGSNVVLWSGNHVGHHSVVEDNCFIASHAVVSGFCTVCRNSFMGVNSTLGDQVRVGEDNWIGAGVTLTRDTPANAVYRVDEPVPSKVPARRLCKVPGDRTAA